MCRVNQILAVAAGGIALAACSSSGSDFMKAATPTMTLQFESEPQGAEVKTSSGQTCRTPCSVAVPAADLTATYALKGYQQQTVPVKLMPPDDPRPDGEVGVLPSARFNPNPVYAELEVAPPAKKQPGKKQPPNATKKPAAGTTARAPSSAAAPAKPTPAPAAQAPTAASPWPPAPNPIR